MKKYFRTQRVTLRPGDGRQKLAAAGNYFRVVSCPVPVLCSFGGVAGHEMELYQGMGIPFGDETYSEVWFEPVGELTAPVTAVFYYGFGEIHDNRAVADIAFTGVNISESHAYTHQIPQVWRNIGHVGFTNGGVPREQAGTHAVYGASSRPNNEVYAGFVCIAPANPHALKRRVTLSRVCTPFSVSAVDFSVFTPVNTHPPAFAVPLYDAPVMTAHAFRMLGASETVEIQGGSAVYIPFAVFVQYGVALAFSVEEWVPDVVRLAALGVPLPGFELPPLDPPPDPFGTPPPNGTTPPPTPPPGGTTLPPQEMPQLPPSAMGDTPTEPPDTNGDGSPDWPTPFGPYGELFALIHVDQTGDPGTPVFGEIQINIPSGQVWSVVATTTEAAFTITFSGSTPGSALAQGGITGGPYTIAYAYTPEPYTPPIPPEVSDPQNGHAGPYAHIEIQLTRTA